MYTEFDFNSRLRRDVPPWVLNTLMGMVEGFDSDAPPAHPDHPFFQTERWRVLFTMDSYYFDADTRSSLRYDKIAGSWYLNVRSNLKNYDNEIGLFLDWIDPYLLKFEGEFLGFMRYEEDETPTLIYKQADVVPRLGEVREGREMSDVEHDLVLLPRPEFRDPARHHFIDDAGNAHAIGCRGCRIEALAAEVVRLAAERDAQEKTLAACARLLGESMPAWEPRPVREVGCSGCAALSAERAEYAGLLTAALEEIESFPVSGYHAGAAQRMARAALTDTKTQSLRHDGGME